MFKFNCETDNLAAVSKFYDDEDQIIKTEELITPHTLVTASFTNLVIEDRILKLVNEIPNTYNSDLVPGTYEGGFKLWECTFDLLKYLSENSIILNKKSILDLGCGTGLLGIFTLLTGAKNVDFQDFNKEVLINTTMNNVLLNCKEKLQFCKFYSGDWKSFTTFNEDTYDLILTSETIYNINNYTKLIKLFEKKLKPSGYILLIAKNYYFGVGGSISEFLNYLKLSKMNSNIVWKSTDGVKKTLLHIHF